MMRARVSKANEHVTWSPSARVHCSRRPRAFKNYVVWQSHDMDFTYFCPIEAVLRVGRDLLMVAKEVK